MIPYSWLVEAERRLDGHIWQTPLTIDESTGLFLKWENHQVTGSFKVRGALNKILSLQSWEQKKGLVAASAGNHGQGVALAGKLVGVPVIIFASENAVPSKVKAMKDLGAEIYLIQGGYGEAERAAIAFARQEGAEWISPYNDGQIIAGQGTIALETLRQLGDFTGKKIESESEMTWIVPVGGGGLMAGIACAILGDVETSHNGKTPGMHRLIAVQSEASSFFHEIYYTGKQDGVEELPSLADGLSGPVEEGSLTIPILRQYVDRFVLVSEEEIAGAVTYAWERYGEYIEGSAAAALAAALTGKVHERPALVVLTGGNIQRETHEEIIKKARVSNEYLSR